MWNFGDIQAESSTVSHLNNSFNFLRCREMFETKVVWFRGGYYAMEKVFLRWTRLRVSKNTLIGFVCFKCSRVVLNTYLSHCCPFEDGFKHRGHLRSLKVAKSSKIIQSNVTFQYSETKENGFTIFKISGPFLKHH